ncbi:MAG: hypothetical protein KDD34_08580 [Bdellovibrionales bacterium]|nr:hypothetical protein [Bdellovibrionales bacterium]
MKTILFLIALSSHWAFAQCPISLNISGQSYCADFQWVYGESKRQGQLQPSDQMSPQLIRKGEAPIKWIYSKGQFQIWKATDTERRSVQIEGFKLFPHMHMKNGHHHGTSYDWGWDASLQAYVFKAMSLHEMPGCWSVRWTLGEETLEGSQLLFSIDSFKNLSETENNKIKKLCVE